MASIFDKYRSWRIRKESSKYNVSRSFTPVKHARTMALLYDADSEQHEALIKKLKAFCETNHLRFTSFGYFDDKELNTHLIPHSNADFFCNKHLDFFKIPHKTEFQRFTSEKYDYLLNLYDKPCLPLLGVSALSEAKFRIGPYWPDYGFCFDLMLQADETDLMRFTDELLIYIRNFGNG